MPKKKFIPLILMAIGGGLLVYTLIAKNEPVYFKIAGVAILMFGLYKISSKRPAENEYTANHGEEIENKKEDGKI